MSLLVLASIQLEECLSVVSHNRQLMRIWSASNMRTQPASAYPALSVCTPIQRESSIGTNTAEYLIHLRS